MSNHSNDNDAAPQRIDADVLIPGRGEPLETGSVIFQGNTIKYAGVRNMVPKEYQNLAACKVPVLMPGMWDSHIHYYGVRSVTSSSAVGKSQILAGARCVPDLEATLKAGFTSVRELGGFGVPLAAIIAEGRVIGPTIYSANHPISMTGGHGDLHDIPIEEFHHACSKGAPFMLADGVDQCLRAVRLQLRAGAKVIKVFASGGVTSQIDDPHHQELSHEELKAIVEEAGRAHRIVAAHTHGKAGIKAALLAGCRTIEHGSYLDDECIDLMLESGAILVATRCVIEGSLKNTQFFTPDSMRKMRALAADHAASYKRAVARGVKIALGTDFFISTDKGDLAYGNNGMELVYAHDAGMTPIQVIEAATANGPMTVGEQAPLSGQLKEGYEADIIALAANPLEDIQVFSSPKNVTHVWRHGTLYKSP